MKEIWITLIWLCLSFSATPQSNYDSIAIRIIDRMAAVIGDMESCSFKLKVANDFADRSGSIVKYFTDYDVFIGGSSKMVVNANGYHGHRQLMYNGEQVAYYSFDENNYAIVNAPNSIIAMFDTLSTRYGLEFPAADFFYPAFTDDLIQSSDSIRFLGNERIGTREFFHVIAYGKEMDVQFWINNNAYTLPESFSITYKRKKGVPQYIGLFSDWQLNPILPNAIFDFSPPPNASRVKIGVKSN
jgi:hypothetical protein